MSSSDLLYSPAIRDSRGKMYYFTGSSDGLISTSKSKAHFAYDLDMATDMSNSMGKFLKEVAVIDRFKPEPLQRKKA